MKHDELRSKVAELRDEIEALAAVENISAEDDARLTAALDEFEALKSELAEVEARAARIEAARASVTERAAGFDAPQIKKAVKTEVDVRSASRGEVRDAALKIAEAGRLSAGQERHIERLLNTNNELTVETLGSGNA